MDRISAELTNENGRSRRPLRLESNPFIARNAAPYHGRPLLSAFRELVREIVQRTPVVVVTGSASAGKSLLASMTAKRCAEIDLSVELAERGEFVQSAPATRPDVLLIDEADSIPDNVLPSLPGRVAGVTVFFCLPSSVQRYAFPHVRSAVIQLLSFDRSDATAYLSELTKRAGLAGIFTDAALALIVDGSDNSPRLLRSVARFAYFSAASDRARQIDREHAILALESLALSGTQSEVGSREPSSATDSIADPGFAAGGETAEMPSETDAEPIEHQNDPQKDKAPVFHAVVEAEATPPVTPDDETPALDASAEGAPERSEDDGDLEPSGGIVTPAREDRVLWQDASVPKRSWNIPVGAIAAGALVAAVAVIAIALPMVLSGRSPPPAVEVQSIPITVSATPVTAAPATASDVASALTSAPLQTVAPVAEPEPAAPAEPPQRPARRRGERRAATRPAFDLTPEEQAAVERGLRAMGQLR
jgi:hypothetical protein